MGSCRATLNSSVHGDLDDAGKRIRAQAAGQRPDMQPRVQADDRAETLVGHQEDVEHAHPVLRYDHRRAQAKADARGDGASLLHLLDDFGRSLQLQKHQRFGIERRQRARASGAGGSAIPARLCRIQAGQPLQAHSSLISADIVADRLRGARSAAPFKMTGANYRRQYAGDFAKGLNAHRLFSVRADALKPGGRVTCRLCRHSMRRADGTESRQLN